MRLGGVHAHSHPHCVRGKERTLSSDGRRNGIGRTLESDEESVALGVDLVSAMGLQRFTEETTSKTTNEATTTPIADSSMPTY